MANECNESIAKLLLSFWIYWGTTSASFGFFLLYVHALALTEKLSNLPGIISLVHGNFVEEEEVHVIDHDLTFSITKIFVGLRAFLDNLIDDFG